MTKEEEKLLRALGSRIRELRVQAGYKNQDSFAYDSEIPRAQYARYEKGVNLTFLSLNKILRFHNISFEEFFKGLK